MPCMDVGERIAFYRRRWRLTQRVLVNLVGLSEDLRRRLRRRSQPAWGSRKRRVCGQEESTGTDRRCWRRTRAGRVQPGQHYPERPRSAAPVSWSPWLRSSGQTRQGRGQSRANGGRGAMDLCSGVPCRFVLMRGSPREGDGLTSGTPHRARQKSSISIRS